MRVWLIALICCLAVLLIVGIVLLTIWLVVRSKPARTAEILVHDISDVAKKAEEIMKPQAATQPQVQQPQKPSSVLCGLQNCGNSCFYNAVVQMYYLRFRQTFPALEPLFAQMDSSNTFIECDEVLADGNTLQTLVKDCQKNTYGVVNGSPQQDASEMIMFGSLQVPPVLHLAFLRGCMQTTWTRDKQSDIPVSMLQLYLPQAVAQTSVQFMLSNYLTQSEQIIDNTCLPPKVSDQSIWITQVGGPLLIQCVRFQQVNGKLQRNDLAIEPSDKLDVMIRTLASNETGFDKTRFDTLSNSSQLKSMQLAGVISQAGTLNSGHYTYWHRMPAGTWVHFNDQNVTAFAASDLQACSSTITKDAYILLYV